MKAFILLCLCLLAATPVYTQEDVQAKHNAYYLCINSIPKLDSPGSPDQAFKNCSAYLQKYPDDDKRLTEFVKRWLTAYKKISAYLDSVKSYTDTKNTQSWIVYKPDIKKKIPIISDSNGNHKIETARHFADSREDKFLKTAEAVYPNPTKSANELYRSWSYWSQDETAPPMGEPMWWTGYSDTILSTKIVTTAAVNYYCDISQKLKHGNNKIKENSFEFYNTNLKYESSIKKMDKYEHNGKTFENVYIADINLTWAQICGGLCGHGFTRNKIVVLDSKGDVLDMFLDAQVNFSSWVS